MHKIFEKTDYGYILRQRNADTIVVATVLFLFALIPLIDLPNRTAHNMQLTINIVCSVFCISLSLCYLRTYCKRIALDEIGIYLHRPLAKTKLIPWGDIKDWGISREITRKHIFSNLYFSTSTLKTNPSKRNKKLPLRCVHTVYISIALDDITDFRKCGVIEFCRSQLIENSIKYPAMFDSDKYGTY